MAIIYSYPSVASLQTTDLFIISRVPTDPDEISNFSVDLNQISSYILTLLELDFAGDVGTGAVDFSPQEVFNIIGTSNEIETTANAQTLQIGLPDNVTITNNLTVGGTGNFTGQVTIPLNPIANTDAASKGYIDSLVTAGLIFKGSFRADTGEILSGANSGSYLYNCPGGAGTRVAVSVGDYYIVANAGGNFYCSGDLLNVGDSIIAVADAAADSSTVNDWATLESDNIEGSGTANKLPIWTDSQILADSLITQEATGVGTIFDFNAIKNGNLYTPSLNTKLLDVNSSGVQKISITQDGGGGVVLPNNGGITNPGPSFNLGGQAFANGENALSVGAATTAFGNGSFAANFLTLASGGGASAFGLLTEAGALASAAFGNKSVASGNYSIASGQDSIASGQSSVAIGEKGDAQGKNTFVQGFGGTATANNAAKFGYEGSASGNNSAKFGFESVASGANSLATGTGTTASGLQSIATGDNNVVSNNNSFVGGKNSTVTGEAAFAFGQANTVSSLTSAAFGRSNTVNGFQSFVAGWSNNTNNYGNQMLLGIGLDSSQNESVILGRYNDTTDNYDKFQIGNGSASNNRSNALSINGAGNVKLPTYGSGTVTGNVAYNLAVTANGEIIESGGAGNYSSFVCLLSQSGTANPQPNNVLENSLGVVSPYTAFSRVSPGEYILNAPGKFKPLKTIMLATSGQGPSGTSNNIGFSFVDADNLRITTSGADNFTKIAIEIRTYN